MFYNCIAGRTRPKRPRGSQKDLVVHAAGCRLRPVKGKDRNTEEEGAGDDGHKEQRR